MEIKKLWFLILLITMFAEGCVSESPDRIKIGILPIEDSLPFLVAKEEGIFEKHGLMVEIVEFNSALERDSALTAKEVDFAITDPLAVILLRSQGFDIKIISICLGKTPKEGVFAILASPNSSIDSIEDINGKEIAVSQNTIIEFATDMMLAPYNITYYTLPVSDIKLRMQNLLDNRIELATLPEPLASYAVAKGAKLVISDAMLEESLTQTVIVARGDLKKEVAKKFLEAYNEAVEKINSNPQKYRSAFVTIARVPADIASEYPMPNYPKPEKFPKEFYEKYLIWAIRKGLLKAEVRYEDAVYDIS